jgi:hypothetical protein
MYLNFDTFQKVKGCFCFHLSRWNFVLKYSNVILFGADPDRIGLLGKPPAVQHSYPFKSQKPYSPPTFPTRKCRYEAIRVWLHTTYISCRSRSWVTSGRNLNINNNHETQYIIITTIINLNPKSLKYLRHSNDWRILNKNAEKYSKI